MEYSIKLREILDMAQFQAARFACQQVQSWHLFLALPLVEDAVAGQVLAEFDDQVPYEDYEAAVILTLERVANSESPKVAKAYLPYSRGTKTLLTDAATIAELSQAKAVGSEHLLFAMLINKDLLPARLFEGVGFLGDGDRPGISLSALRRSLEHHGGFNKDQVKSFYDLKRTPKAKASSMQMMNNPMVTPLGDLEDYTTDLTEAARLGKLDPVLGREAELSRMIQVLSRKTKNNPVLVGESGVGKTALAYGLAQRIIAGEVPQSLEGKRVLELEMMNVVAGTRFRGDFEERMNLILSEVEAAGDIILFIDEVHSILGAGAGVESTMDAANLLKPGLARGALHLVGATTLQEYQKHIEKDAALSRRFAKVLVEEPSIADSVEILTGLRERYETYHKVVITDQAIETAVKAAKRYLTSKKLPDSAIDLLDEASATRQNQAQPSEEASLSPADRAILAGQFEGLADLLEQEAKGGQQEPLTVTEDHVLETLSRLSGIPVQKMTQADNQRYLNLETELHKRVIGQEQAVSAISRAIRRNQAGIRTGKRPIGSFMFLGPTGVGKTELAKALAEVLFDDEGALLRFDMSEYMEKFAASRLNGAPPGYVGHDDGGELTEKVRNKPYAVLLFDEIEKAHPDVFNLFLQILDDGQLTDSRGRRVDFSNTLIIMTSNLGATALRDDKTVGFGAKDLSRDHAAMEKRILEELKTTYRPELLNRIDDKLVFHSLTESHVQDIVGLMVAPLIKRLAEQGVTLKFQPSALKHLAKDGYDLELGARPLRRTIQNQIEDKLAELLLSGDLLPGKTLKIGLSKGRLTFTVV